MPAKRSRWEFWEYVAKKDDNACWLWQGATSKTGHGRLRAEGQSWYAHRLAYESFYGELPSWSFNSEIRHMCNTPACCNPKHLRLGTRAENMKDAGESGVLSRPGMNNGNCKLTDAQVRAIRADPRPSRSIAATYGVEKTQILRIKKNAQRVLPYES